MSEQIKLFSSYFNEKIKQDKSFLNTAMTKNAYLIGAYSKAIIDSSYNEDGDVVSKNETFKKWLSNQQIIEQNLKKIFNKANSFERKFRLNTLRNQDLSELVTKYFKEDENIRTTQQEISFAFIRGFNDYRIFKKENPYVEKTNTQGVDENE